jgi:hypothetical protein
VFRLVGPAFPDVVADPAFRLIGHRGGIAMLRGPDAPPDVVRTLGRSEGVGVATAGSPEEVLDALARVRDAGVLVAVVVESPDPALPGSLVWAPSVELRPGPIDAPATLSSDSTRRVGIVTPDDLAATVAEAIDDPSIDAGNGSAIEVVDAPPPVDLYDRYAAYRELTVPVQAGVAAWELSLGAWALWAIRSGRTRRAALAAVLSLPGLFLALLLVGHLPRLTPVSVPLTLAIASLASAALWLRVSDRAGAGAALAWAGGVALGGLVVESLLGWTAAFAPMLGGSHLDGARFYGMPNAAIGLAVGGALLVAHRVRSIRAGVAVLAATSLWAGAPWFGANLGAAVTAGAAAGLWWGVGGRLRALPTAAATAVAAAVGVLAAAATNRLDARPTHIARAAGASVADLVATLAHRLGIGARLLADQPAALLPVAGTAVGLWLVARPPRALAAGFERSPRSREVALAIGLAGAVAYVANDTGAAALGLGFGLLAVTLAAVSLAAPPDRMQA